MAGEDCQLAALFTEAYRARLDYLHGLGVGALRQLNDEQAHRPSGLGLTSAAIIVKHLLGNARSRFTDFLGSDGEKPWRDRDAEFADDDAAAAEVIARWDEAFAVLGRAVAELRPDDLMRTVAIRGQTHSVPLALLRALDHFAYHTGQVVWAAKMAVGVEHWETLTIAPGDSAKFNASLGFDPDAKG